MRITNVLHLFSFLIFSPLTQRRSTLVCNNQHFHLMKRQKQVSDLESNNVLSVDFTDVMFSQQAVASSRGILDQWGDFTGLVDEAHVAWAVFVHGDGALKWPIDTRKRLVIYRWKSLVTKNLNVSKCITMILKTKEKEKYNITWPKGETASDGTTSRGSHIFVLTQKMQDG